MKKTKLLIAAAFAVLLSTMMTACGYSVPSDMVAIRVGAGPTEAKKIKGCVNSNERDWFWQTNDSYYYFPTNEREWDATGQKGSDTGRMKSITLDNVEMLIPVTVRFTLKTECDDLKDFYTRYARRYGVKFSNDGSYNEEWITLLRKLVGDPTDQSLDRIVQGYNWRDVWKNPETKTEIEKKLNDALQSKTSLLVQTAKGEFFEGISVLVGTPEPLNDALRTAVAEEQTRVSQAQSEEAQARADAAKAEAQLAVSRAEAAKQRAAIAGYPSVEAYLKAQCIAQGCNPYQPTYLYGGPNAQ